ncbi:MAG: ABC transporter ATP-binding protein [Pseudomonadota bacterium]|nr:ABC transporter ATP-binding protein [Pseudomonadota bacterium]
MKDGAFHGSDQSQENVLVRTERLGRDFSIGGQGIRAIDEIDLTIVRGEFVALMGPSGSGKSTLLNILGLLDRATRGLYVFEGREVSGIDADQCAFIRNRKVGFVFQNFSLLARTSARENVELPLLYNGMPRRQRQSLAAAALAEVGLEHRLGHRPNQLSGGEQQRVAIARALVSRPVLILADEPTGALDSRTGLEIMKLMRRLHRSGNTIITATHDPNVARYAETIVSLQDGRITGCRRMHTAPHRGEGTLSAAMQDGIS